MRLRIAHLASAFYVSPYQKAAIISVDGFGDFSSGSWGVVMALILPSAVLLSSLVRRFLSFITQFIGFPNCSDEYKVMGLAPYGKPKYLDKMRDVVLLEDDGSYKLNLKYFVFHKEKVAYEWDTCVSPSVGQLFSHELEALLGCARQGADITQYHKDIAASAQAMFEIALFHMLNKVWIRRV